VHKGAALHVGKDRRVDRLGEVLTAEDHAAAGASQRLVRGSGYHVGKGYGAGMHSTRHQAGNVRHVEHEFGADRIGNGTEPGEIKDPRVGAGAGDQQLGAERLGMIGQRVVVDLLSLLIDAVPLELVQLAGEIEPSAVGKMAAVSMARTRSPGSSKAA